METVQKDHGEDGTSPLIGKAALVTGASQGIGLAIAWGLAKAGASLVLVDKNPAVTAQAKAMKQAGYAALAVQADLTDETELARVFSEVSASHDTLDILVNNAAILISKPARAYTRAEWMRLVETNLSACYFVAMEAAKLFELNGGGKTKATRILHHVMLGTGERRLSREAQFEKPTQ